MAKHKDECTLRSGVVDNSGRVYGQSAPMAGSQIPRPVDGVRMPTRTSTDADRTVPVRHGTSFDRRSVVRVGAAGYEAGVQR